MKRPCPCSKCGLACYSTWKSEHTIKPATCKACKSREKQTCPDNQSSIQIQDNSCIGPSLDLSLSLSLGNQESNVENKFANKEKSSSLWNPKIFQKRRRSKLPQYTLSPIERFMNQLHQAAIRQNLKGVSANEGRSLPREEPKYDDVLIYEKCKLIPHNEIGVGAVLLSPHVPLEVKKEPYTDGDYNACCLFDVPIRGPSE